MDLPFIGNETITLGKNIINLAKSVRPDPHIQPVFRPPPAIATFFPQRDRITKNAQANIVYMISCLDCNESYIGKTIRQASRRHQEHGAPSQLKSWITSSVTVPSVECQQLRKSNRLRTKPRMNYCLDQKDCNDQSQVTNEKQLLRSALYKQQTNTNHRINWNAWKIISKDSNKYRLLVRESLQILHRKPSLNQTTCSVPLIVYPEGLQKSKPTVKIKSTENNRP